MRKRKLHQPNLGVEKRINQAILWLMFIVLVLWGSGMNLLPYSTVPLIGHWFLLHQPYLKLWAILLTLLLLFILTVDWLNSRKSPLSIIQLKYALLDLPEEILPQGAEVYYQVTSNHFWQVEIFSCATFDDDQLLGEQLSKIFRKKLYSFQPEWAGIPAFYVFGESPKQLNGIKEITDD